MSETPSGDAPTPASLDAELDAFNRFFTQLQPDGVGLMRVEEAILRSYLIWVSRGRPQK